MLKQEHIMDKIYSCPYCHGPCKLDEKDDKIFLDCPSCGYKEGTKRLKELLMKQKEK
jgi:hypothetical protein